MRVLRGAAIAALVVVVAGGLFAARSGPTASSAVGSGLAGVACPSARHCLAVGSQTDRADLGEPLTETWDGRSWTLRRSPTPSRVTDSAFEAVACSSPSSCVAVGNRESQAAYLGSGTPGGLPLAASWDGRGWKLRAIAGPSGAADSALHAVSCPSTTCVAVGDGETLAGRELTFAESWDGARWTLDVTPDPGSAEDSFLASVACTSPTSCVAVGHYEYEVQQIDHRQATLIESWNGTVWRIVPSPNPGGSTDSELNGVDCASPTSCMAVGFQRLANGAYAPLAEVWNGRAWRLSKAPIIPRSPDTEMAAVSCPDATRCVAVGFARTGPQAVMVAMSFDAGTWVIRPTPTIAGAADSALSSVDCDSANACIGVGTYRKPSLLQVGFAVAWDGAIWTVTPMPGIPGAS